MRQTRRPASVAISSSSPGCEAERLGHPRGHAARAVAADLGDGAVGVVQADAAGVLGPGPGEELDAVGADAGVARAEPPRQVSPIVVCRGLFGDDQKIVAAGVGLGKGDQSSSDRGR